MIKQTSSGIIQESRSRGGITYLAPYTDSRFRVIQSFVLSRESSGMLCPMPNELVFTSDHEPNFSAQHRTSDISLVRRLHVESVASVRLLFVAIVLYMALHQSPG
jgi:hypothetical protein